MTIIEEPSDSGVAGLTAAVLVEEERRFSDQSTREHGSADPEALLPGVGGDELPWATVVERGGTATVGALTLLNLVDEFDRAALAVLAPDIQASLGLSDAAISLIGAIGSAMVLFGAVPFGMWADRSRRRPLIIAASSVVWAIAAMSAGVVRAGWHLGITRFVNGIGKANEPVHKSILADRYPLEGRARVFSLHAAANAAGLIAGPLLVGLVVTVAGGDEAWRWAFVVLSVPAVALAVIVARLPDPERGRYEQEAVLGTVALADSDDRISMSAALERLKKIRTFFLVMSGIGVIGFALIAVPTIFNLFLEEEYGLSAWERGLVGAVTATGSLVGYIVGGRLGDRRFGSDPESVLRIVGLGIIAFGFVYALALFMPNLVMMVVLLTGALGFVGAAVAPLDAAVAAVTPHRLRGVGFALRNVYAGLAGVVGSVVIGVFSDSWGERTALIVALPIACVVGGALITVASRHLRADLAMVASELREDLREETRLAGSGAADTPLLQVSHLDFSYGPVQVLFDVNLEVERGEVLALLGTNGAGKSTVLRAICGLQLPDRGAIRLNGRTITYSSAEARVGMGIVQVPGGKGVFGPMTVHENLLAAAHSFIYDEERIQARYTRVLGMFPRLGERFDQPAETMSGGEQQMLAIASALMLEPELLLIDELSLGLAPVVVEELLVAVEELKAEGVTMIIVEQSVNVACALAERAIFMEKGQVRFSGPARELLERDDLARAVFFGAGNEGPGT